MLTLAGPGWQALNIRQSISSPKTEQASGRCAVWLPESQSHVTAATYLRVYSIQCGSGSGSLPTISLACRYPRTKRQSVLKTHPTGQKTSVAL